MKHDTDTTPHPQRPLAGLLALTVIGLALIVALISTTTGGSKVASLQAGHGQPTPAVQTAQTNKPAAPTAKAKRHPMTAAPTPKPANQTRAPATSPGSGIPQGDGGDGDPDNNGGPSDGDGSI